MTTYNASAPGANVVLDEQKSYLKYNPTSLTDAFAHIKNVLQAVPNMDLQQKMDVKWFETMAQMQVFAIASKKPFQSFFLAGTTGFDWNTLIQMALALLASFLPTTGIWATLLPIIEALLAQLFPPTPVPPVTT